MGVETPTAPVLDAARLAALRDLDPDGGDELVAAVLDAFRDQAITQLAEVESAIDSSGFDIVSRRAHSLKGAAADVGAARMGQLCAQLEAAAASGNPATLSALAAQLRVEFDRLQAAVDLEVRP